mmetsp:Transcript_29158/g.33579  ORF Transcript_29158/g.33579 Transcript_29158/m.33579 type:complete len:107 (+) Transcript_29158:685-1005(+)
MCQPPESTNRGYGTQYVSAGVGSGAVGREHGHHGGDTGFARILFRGGKSRAAGCFGAADWVGEEFGYERDTKFGCGEERFGTLGGWSWTQGLENENMTHVSFPDEQ